MFTLSFVLRKHRSVHLTPGCSLVAKNSGFQKVCEVYSNIKFRVRKVLLWLPLGCSLVHGCCLLSGDFWDDDHCLSGNYKLANSLLSGARPNLPAVPSGLHPYPTHNTFLHGLILRPRISPPRRGWRQSVFLMGPLSCALKSICRSPRRR